MLEDVQILTFHHPTAVIFSIFLCTIDMIAIICTVALSYVVYRCFKHVGRRSIQLHEQELLQIAVKLVDSPDFAANRVKQARVSEIIALLRPRFENKMLPPIKP